jgi:hypothetical protein
MAGVWQDSREQVEALLNKIPAMFANTTNPDSCLMPAIQAGTALMQHIGGKVCLLHIRGREREIEM